MIHDCQDQYHCCIAPVPIIVVRCLVSIWTCLASSVNPQSWMAKQRIQTYCKCTKGEAIVRPLQDHPEFSPPWVKSKSNQTQQAKGWHKLVQYMNSLWYHKLTHKMLSFLYPSPLPCFRCSSCCWAGFWFCWLRWRCFRPLCRLHGRLGDLATALTAKKSARLERSSHICTLQFESSRGSRLHFPHAVPRATFSAWART